MWDSELVNYTLKVLRLRSDEEAERVDKLEIIAKITSLPINRHFRDIIKKF